MSATATVPYSEQAESSVIGRMLAEPSCIGEVSATLLEGSHFYIAAHRVLYDAIIQAFFASDPIDPLTIGTLASKRLSKLWGCSEQQAVDRVASYASGQGFGGDPVAHAYLVKRDADFRALLSLSHDIQTAVEAETLNPDQIAGMASSSAMRIATNSLVAHEIVHFADAGRNFIREMRERMARKQAGIEIGAKYGISAIDAYTMGVQPSELLIAGGEPGVGKSAVWWKCAMNFAERQMKSQPNANDRVGTLILSLEMGELPSSTRWAQSLTAIDSAHMRGGDLSQAELQKITTEWGRKKEYPLWLNYASGLRLSQLRAVVAEAIQKYNVGHIIIDHFSLLFPDTPMDSNEADAERVIFLKNQIAKEMDVAVICLAHTRKGIERPDKRPRLSDLRGSGQIAAFADFVALMFRPWPYASEKDRDSGKVQPNDAEMLFVKNRHGLEGTGNLFFDPSRMLVL